MMAQSRHAPAKPAADPGTIRVLVADDHPVVRFGLVSLINAQPGMTVVGETCGCAECRSKLAGLDPDVVVLDLEMEDCSGAQAIEQITSATEARVIVYTSFLEDWLVSDAMRLGVHGYVHKGAPPETLVAAITAVHDGHKFLDPQVTAKLVAEFGKPEERRAWNRTLTAREMEVLRNVAMGRKNSEISRALCVSERTVKTHISAVLRKLDAANRAEAVRIGIQRGWLSSG